MVVRNRRGQSILEFLFSLPIMFGITLLLVRVNTAIQSGIVQQKYARNRVAFFTYNSPYFPAKRLSGRMGYGDTPARQGKSGSNEFMIGVSGTPITDGGRTTPSALEIPVNKKGPKHPEQGIPEASRSIFVRTTVSLCTKSHVLGNGALLKAGNGGLNEDSTFAFCQGRFD